MEPQQKTNSQSNLEKEEQGWRYHPHQFQTILNRGPRNKQMVM